MSGNTDVEHASLRAEIIENSNYSVGVANFVVTLTGAVILAAFEFQNPYLALLPLFPLYYGHLIAFSASQTIARTSVYLRLVEKERYEILLHRLRLHTMKPRGEHDPSVVIRERWISPTLQMMFIFLGFICLLLYGYIAWRLGSTPSVTPPPIPNSVPDLMLPRPLNVMIFIVVSLIWIRVAWFSVSKSRAMYGGGNMIEEFEKAWESVMSQ